MGIQRGSADAHEMNSLLKPDEIGRKNVSTNLPCLEHERISAAQITEESRGTNVREKLETGQIKYQ